MQPHYLTEEVVRSTPQVYIIAHTHRQRLLAREAAVHIRLLVFCVLRTIQIGRINATKCLQVDLHRGCRGLFEKVSDAIGHIAICLHSLHVTSLCHLLLVVLHCT